LSGQAVEVCEGILKIGRAASLFDEALQATRPTSEREFEIADSAVGHISWRVRKLRREFPFTNVPI